MRDARAQELDDLGGARLRAGLEHHAGLHRLAPLRVGHADHRAVGDRRVLHQRVLDLGRIDVLAARQDHVLDAVMYVQIAVAQVAAIAGAEPAHARRIAIDESIDGGLRIGPVALHVLRGADPHLADPTRRGIGAGGRIDHAQLDVQHRPARRAQQLFPRSFRVVVLGRQESHRPGGLGQAVDLDEVALEGSHRADQHALRDGRRAVGDRLERGVVALFHARHLQQELDHRRHEEAVRDAVLGDRRQNLGWVEIRIQHAVAAGRRRQQRHAGSRDVIGRQHVEEHVGRAAVVDGLRRGLDHAGADVAMRELDALGQPGRARGVELQRGVALRHRQTGVRGIEAGAPVGEALQSVERVIGGERQLQARHRHGACRSRERRVDHQQARLAVVEDIFDLGRREAPVHRHAHRAGLVAGQREQHAFDRVLGQAGDALALAHAQGQQPLRDAVRRRLELREAPGARRCPVGHGVRLGARVAPDRIDYEFHPPSSKRGDRREPTATGRGVPQPPLCRAAGRG